MDQPNHIMKFENIQSGYRMGLKETEDQYVQQLVQLGHDYIVSHDLEDKTIRDLAMQLGGFESGYDDELLAASEEAHEKSKELKEQADQELNRVNWKKLGLMLTPMTVGAALVSFNMLPSEINPLLAFAAGCLGTTVTALVLPNIPKSAKEKSRSLEAEARIYSKRERMLKNQAETLPEAFDVTMAFLQNDPSYITELTETGKTKPRSEQVLMLLNHMIAPLSASRQDIQP